METGSPSRRGIEYNSRLQLFPHRYTIESSQHKADLRTKQFRRQQLSINLGASAPTVDAAGGAN